MPGLVENVFLGSGLAFAAAVQPGPLQAFLVSRVVARGWRHTLPACIAPLLSDGPIALLLTQPPRIERFPVVDVLRADLMASVAPLES